MTISDEYRALNQELHAKNQGWGTSAKLRIHEVKKLAARLGAQTIIDYGCGKGNMQVHSRLKMDEYDPCIPGKDVLPKRKYDMVVCTDVMEHVEPEYVDDVLQEINGLFTKGAYFLIYLVPAVHKLPDGSNCHRTIQSAEWWVEKVQEICGVTTEWSSTRTELSLVAIRDTHQ